jgi:hypothetical protein
MLQSHRFTPNFRIILMLDGLGHALPVERSSFTTC